MSITVYTKSGFCGMCKATERALASAGIEYTEQLLEDVNQAQIEEWKTTLGTNAPIVVTDTETGWWQNHLVRKAGRRGRDRVPPTQAVLFRAEDERGGPEAYPTYPCSSDGRADHQEAMRFVRRGLLQELRHLELAA